MKLLIENFKKYISEESLGDFSDEGMVNLYHYTNPRNVEGRDSIILDPQYFVNSRGAYSKREWETSRYPRTFFYTDYENKEPIVNGALVSTSVPTNEIYDLKNDPEGYVEKHRHPTYGLRKQMEWETMMKDIHSSYRGIYYSIGKPNVVAWFNPIEVFPHEK
jgi:hypothetical protein|tara:strand:- start:100 stop:585 length:486 start_codon:yes stop_codon:yes gene_type:complete